jgi:Asp-tRNA(Asn)/Glu-tRNA(Gln) amidotransferase A subunit family amidase
VGIKDIVDTAGIPTEHGSPHFAGRVPERPADVVAALERAGAIVLGKMVTTEVAYYQPGPTTNPWNPSRTSGGSSMGSAAGVAAGMVLGAVGTQTNGSVIRPASFCGVVGFKPSAGRISKAGVMVFSPTLDQLGCFARSVRGTSLMAAAMAGEATEAWIPDMPLEPRLNERHRGRCTAHHRWHDRSRGGFRLAAVPTAEWPYAEPAMRERFEADVAALAAAGARIERPALPAGLDESPPVHRTIMAYEGHESLGRTVASDPDAFSDTLKRFLAEGAGIAAARYREALRERARLIGAFGSWARDFDAILTPPALGEAPTPETTGDPRCCTRWTLLGAPALTLPTGLGPAGLPLGLQVVGVPGDDARLLGAASWIEHALPRFGWPA